MTEPETIAAGADRYDAELLEFGAVVEELAGLTRLPQAREMALALQPMDSPSDVAAAQAETAEAAALLEQGSEPRFGSASDPRETLKRVAIGGVLSGEELIALAYFLSEGLQATRKISRCEAAAPGMARLAAGAADPGDLAKAIRRAVAENGDVKDGASPRLGRLRQNSARAYGRLIQVFSKLTEDADLMKLMQSDHIASRNNRLALEVKSEFRRELPGIVQGISSSGATVFVEPLQAVEPCNQWRELEGQVKREEMRILQEMTDLAAAQLGEMRRFAELLARLDLAMAKGKLAARMGASMPKTSRRKGALRLEAARHPLLREHAVPSDIALKAPVKGLVVSGPNAGGKTVTLKTAGLLALMHQAGLHLPAAEGSELSVFDGVHADIGDGQSIEGAISTFSARIGKINRILAAAGKGSLVLLDELGASTDPDEGAALACAVLERLAEAGACLVATTHYRRVVEFAAESSMLENASVEFNAATLEHTYKLTTGLPGRSYAFELARSMGLPDALLKRAEQFAAPSQRESEKLLEQIEQHRDEARRQMESAREAARQAGEDRDEARRQLNAGQVERERLMEQARTALRGEMERARRQPGSGAAREKRRAVSEREAVERALKRISGAVSEPSWKPLTSDSDDAGEVDALPVARLEDLRAGDWVVVENFNKRAQVVAVRSSGEVELTMGIARIKAQPGQLRKIDGA